MKTIQVLDCTLRDGGYCNKWQFGYLNTKKIIAGLCEANVDIVECGFLTNKVVYDNNVTKFTTIDQINDFMPANKQGKLFVAMMNYGEYEMNDLPDRTDSSIDGLRVAFHKKNRYEAIKLCHEIKKKGYKVFVQPMVSVSYSDLEYVEMIKLVNELKPYAFYIVDSFGMMKNKDLMRLYYLVEHNLDEDIKIGFHSHNNLQLAFSNATSLVNNQTDRELIIDSSIYGMGRGAGNLNTELFLEYLNDFSKAHYSIKPLLNIIDTILNKFYHDNYWGYSLPNYLSAKHNAHPNYAGFLSDKNTLTFENIDQIFEMMSEEKKVEFDKQYIEELYLKFMEKDKTQNTRANDLREKFNNKEVLLIAPGLSSQMEKEKIIDFANKNGVITISVNSIYPYYNCNYVFVSNLRRFNEMPNKGQQKIIATSNIPYSDVFYQTDYKELLNNEEFVSDNAGLLAINLLIKFGSKKVYLAGFDGYSHETKDNYSNDMLAIVTKNAVLDSMNSGMSKVLGEYSKQIKIEFLTTQKHLKLGE